MSRIQDWADSRRTQAATGAPSGAIAAPAATVVLLRDTDDGIEVLLGRRSSKLAFHGGAWVFPGGRVDPEDYADDPDDVFAAARRAAVREALEEAAVHVDVETLVHMSKWTTPEVAPKRFATWFFAGEVRDGDEVADGTETEVVAWFRPAEALAARARGEIELAPPQFVTLDVLSRYGTTADALAGIEATEPFHYEPRFHFTEEHPAMCVYSGDVAYEDVAFIDANGPRHRIVMAKDGWEYIRS